MTRTKFTGIENRIVSKGRIENTQASILRSLFLAPLVLFLYLLFLETKEKIVQCDSEMHRVIHLLLGV